MALSNRPLAGSPLIGSISIELYLTANGVQPAYGYDGISKTTAIGHLVEVTDRLREERKYEWDTCPDCKRPWAAHDADYEADDDDEYES